uniref:Putative endonuclease/reverse transcript n=1 Tax=Ixodes ricinus TaxID=34613 RepID=A0A0K8RC66_IXORI
MAARFICNKYSRHVSPSELCRQLGLSSLEKRAKMARLKFLYELANDHFNLPKENYLNHTSKRLTRTTIASFTRKTSLIITALNSLFSPEPLTNGTTCLKMLFIPLLLKYSSIT